MYVDMLNVLGESTASNATVKNWIAGFKRGCTSIKDESQSVRPLIKCKPRYTMTLVVPPKTFVIYGIQKYISLTPIITISD